MHSFAACLIKKMTNMNAKLIKKLPIVVIILLTGLSTTSYPCTTFCLKNGNQIVYGRNFDFPFGSGFIATNRKDLLKVAFLSPNERPISWVSKYGSITFNQIGMEFPYEGMNEKGLVVAQMYFEASKYPLSDNREAINCLQWIQYQLDVSSTIYDVIASDTFLRISNEMPVGIHFLICDKNGNIVTIEFINGKMVFHTGETLPIPLLQNQAYDISYEYLKKFKGFGGDQMIPWKSIDDYQWSDDSIQLCQNKAFAIAANRMKNYDHSKSLIENTFDVLSTVTINNVTQWSSVFDMTNMKIHFKNYKRNEIMTIDFEDFSFENSAESKILEIQSCSANSILSQFNAYSIEFNRKYAFESYNYMSNSGFIPFKLPIEVIEMQARYPETIKIFDKQNK
jgi:penicillin V acylase-like amidase (Ntn superfamily)